MKIKPLIFDNIDTRHTSFRIAFRLDNNITLIKGDSGVGNSTVFSILEELAVENERIRCLNYLDIKKNYKNSIQKFKGKLIVVDNADLLLDDKMREHIARDESNQYILIGRNPKGLRLNYDEICELKSIAQDETTTFSLERACL